MQRVTIRSAQQSLCSKRSISTLKEMQLTIHKMRNQQKHTAGGSQRNKKRPAPVSPQLLRPPPPQQQQQQHQWTNQQQQPPQQQQPHQWPNQQQRVPHHHQQQQHQPQQRHQWSNTHQQPQQQWSNTNQQPNLQQQQQQQRHQRPNTHQQPNLQPQQQQQQQQRQWSNTQQQQQSGPSPSPFQQRPTLYNRRQPRPAFAIPASRNPPSSPSTTDNTTTDVLQSLSKKLVRPSTDGISTETLRSGFAAQFSAKKDNQPQTSSFLPKQSLSATLQLDRPADAPKIQTSYLKDGRADLSLVPSKGAHQQTANADQQKKADSPLLDVSEFIRLLNKQPVEKRVTQPAPSPAKKSPSYQWRTQRPTTRPPPGIRDTSRFSPPRPSWTDQHQPKTVTVKSNPKDQIYTIPHSNISLTEASKLFRTKTQFLAKTLERELDIRVPKVGEKHRRDYDGSYSLDPDQVELLAMQLDLQFEKAVAPSVQDKSLGSRRTQVEETLPSRPPVVCIMGHVDHGKTTIMDALRRRAFGGDASSGRKSKKGKKKKKKVAKTASGNAAGDVAGTEAGGITQIISAFQVPLEGSEPLTFLDTPGHAAFKAMRQSGSDAADVIVLVIAADDGVSPQTIEILNFYKQIWKSGNGGISLVVAMNKIDKPGVEVKESLFRIQNQLLEQGIVTEGTNVDDADYGGPVQIIPVSGLTGQGLDDLIEGLVLQSEMMDLRADPEATAEGVVMDTRVEKGLGTVADCIIRWGSIQRGDIVVSGTSWGKVKILKDGQDTKQIKKGMPSEPVRIVGFQSPPKAGDPLVSVESEEVAKELVERRKRIEEKEKETLTPHIGIGDTELQSAGKHMMMSAWQTNLESKFGLNQKEEDSPIRIPVVIKADADGTLAALRESLIEMGQRSKENVTIDPILAKVGPLQTSEVQLAIEAGAPICCFNVKLEAVTKKMAENNEVKLLESKVIYSLLDEAKIVFGEWLPSQQVEVTLGRATVKAVFDIGGIDDRVAGLKVGEGSLWLKKKGPHRYRVIRNGEVVADKKRPTSLKHIKDDIEEAKVNSECGLSVDGFGDYEAGDEVVCYVVETRQPTL